MDEAIRRRAMEIREFNRFYTNIIGLVNQTILDSPYSLAEVRTLLEIMMAGECTAADLTRRLAIDPGYLSRMIRRFKKEKLLTAARSPADGRARLLALTEKGRGVIGPLAEASTRQVAALLAAMPEEEQQELVEHMRAVQALLSRRPDREAAIRRRRPPERGAPIACPIRWGCSSRAMRGPGSTPGGRPG